MVRMRKFTDLEKEEIVNGDEKHKPFVDMNKWPDFDLKNKVTYNLVLQEFERLYCKWRFYVFEGKLGYFSCKQPKYKNLLKKLITFCYENNCQPFSILMWLHNKAVNNKVNIEAFYNLYYIVSDNLLNGYLQDKMKLSKNTKVENSFANSLNNQDINFLIRNHLKDKFDMSLYDDRYIQTIIAVIKDMSLNKRINCSQNIKDMCNYCLQSKAIAEHFNVKNARTNN